MAKSLGPLRSPGPLPLASRDLHQCRPHSGSDLAVSAQADQANTGREARLEDMPRPPGGPVRSSGVLQGMEESKHQGLTRQDMLCAQQPGRAGEAVQEGWWKQGDPVTPRTAAGGQAARPVLDKTGRTFSQLLTEAFTNSAHELSNEEVFSKS
ncbi:unnamed protein product [Rangifer tarandus platyrhynchus]|uniref:Uncharacterized protein n=1 Tax=Rangifer tarandus platyrhynchus TaxID=3082113 RepID=A0AC59ZYQ5_RANTA